MPVTKQNRLWKWKEKISEINFQRKHLSCAAAYNLIQFTLFIFRLSREWKIIYEIIARRCVVKVSWRRAFKLNRVLINYATMLSSTALSTVFNYKLSMDFLICKWNISDSLDEYAEDLNFNPQVECLLWFACEWE